MDQLKAIRYFIVTTEKGSFTQAAKHFNVPASSISRRIADLEQSLAAQLFVRTTRNVSLTEVGSQYFSHVKAIMQQLDQSEQLVRDYHSTPKGKLKISCMVGFGELKLQPVLNLFRQHYPDITLEVEFSDTLSNLGRDDVDIAIRGGFAPDERVVAIKLMSNEFVAAASQSYFEQFGLPQTSSELSKHRGLYYKAPGGITPWLTKVEGQWQDVSAPAVLSSNSGRWLIERAIEGEGIVMLPQWVLDPHFASGELQELSFPQPLRVTQQVELGVYMLYQRLSYSTPKVKVAVDFLKSHLQKQP
ncbi:LysR substrate-binding domain-containing protein [Vibrio sp. FNV 38]|nr:LysR substrate-binding domain-containing protein [Vibrio sp. FNV 38]